MSKQIGLIHATLNAVQPMVAAFGQYEPGVTLLHFLDEGLLMAVNEQGGVTPPTLRRLLSLLSRAEESGVDGILLTCSAFSPNVPSIGPLFSIPVVSVDRAMLEQAVTMGSRIGVIATVATAGPATARQLEEIAAARGKQVAVETVVSTDAFSQLQAGNVIDHDVLLQEAAEGLLGKVDVIVLAQISMARAASRLDRIDIPVLTSPRSSIEAIMGRLP
ncbi:MAG: aspartate/glutamate racemase family protein [Negativicutes bacterium]|nr:aspartate/glutamate racemase family protein [Negativicutes bacterium]